MSKLLIVTLSLALAGCVSFMAGPTESEDLIEPLPYNYFEAQQQCIGSWRRLIIEWRDSGGKIYGSLQETRRALKASSSSGLARLFQAHWNWQMQHPQVDPRDTFSLTAEGFVPEQCAVYSLLGEHLASVDGVINEQAAAELIAQAGGVGVDDLPGLGVWVISELLSANSPEE